MRIIRHVGIASLYLLALTHVVAQKPATRTVTAHPSGIGRVVQMEITFQAPQGQEIFLHYCGEVDGMKVLCTFLSQVEVHRGAEWRIAAPADEGFVLGGIPAKKGAAVRHTGQRLTYRFDPEYYGVKHGDLVRIILWGWPDETMKNNDSKVRIVTDSFRVP